MSKIIQILTGLLHKLGMGTPEEQPSGRPTPLEPQTDPRRGVIEKEPLLALENENWVMVIEHHFENIPSWIEWDKERQIVTITQMNGDLDEAPLVLKDEMIDQLRNIKKLLLVSNDNNERILQRVPFFARLD